MRLLTRNMRLLTGKLGVSYFKNVFLFRSDGYCTKYTYVPPSGPSYSRKGYNYRRTDSCGALMRNNSDEWFTDPDRPLKPFDEIPGPISLPIIGTLWAYLPIIGPYKFSNVYESCLKRYMKYGDVVREQIMPGVNILYLFKAEDIERLLKITASRPERRSHIMVMNYRKKRPDYYSNGGLLPTNGDEWWRIRSKFQKPLSSPLKAAVYINKTDAKVCNYIDKLCREQQKWIANDKGFDFLDQLSRIYLELIMLIAFDCEMDTFCENELKADSTSSKLIEAAMNISKNVVKTDALPEFMSYFPLKAYRQMKKGQCYLQEVAFLLISGKLRGMNFDDQIEEKSEDKNDKREEKSLLETYLGDTNCSFKDVLGISIDLMLAGVDTTTFTTSFALYHLAKNPVVQRKLYDETIQLLPNTNDKITDETLEKAVYLKAFLKESLRLNPISVGIGRLLPKDVYLAGYLVPKGTIVVTGNQVCCKMPHYFERADDVIPERWLRDNDFPRPTSHFASLPFGYGSRMCIARRLAEQNMYIVLMRLVRTFEIGWTGKDLGMKSETINKPAGPVTITLKKRVKKI